MIPQGPEPACVHVVGASGRSGAALCRSLLADGVAFVPVVRSAARWAATGLPGEPRLADLADAAAAGKPCVAGAAGRPGEERLANVADAAKAGELHKAGAGRRPGEERLAGLAGAAAWRGEPGEGAGILPDQPGALDTSAGARLRAGLAGATHVVSCAHARHAAAILAAAPGDAVFVFLGSTRKYTAWPDAHGRGVLAGEAAFLASGRRGVMLHPTMIYGAQGEDNVQRLAALLRRLAVVPLPGGGRALVQPIHQDDVTRCLRAALRTGWAGAEVLVIAGPAAVSYADFVRAVAAASRLRPPRIVSVPAAPLRLLVRLLPALPRLPRIGPDEVRRLTEDKAFDIAEMTARLAVAPMGLQAGLARSSLADKGETAHRSARPAPDTAS